MVLQAIVDDSGSEPQSLAFILGGFVASPLAWAKFSDEWESVLSLPPRLEYFKNNEAMALKGQFDRRRGWNEQRRDDRVVSLANVVKSHIQERFSVAIRHSDYKRYMHGIPVVRRMKTLEDPYFMLFHDFMLIVACVHSLETEAIPCEFLFDDQGKTGRRAAAWWTTFRTSMRTAKFDYRPYLAQSEPSFKRDTEFKPLQAADLYAGQLNRVMASDKIIIPPSPALRVLWSISGYHRVLDYKYLAPLRDNFMAMAKAIDAKEPERLKYLLGRPTQRRKKNK